MLLLNGFGELSDCPSCLTRHTKKGLLCVFLTWVTCLCCFLTCLSLLCCSVEVQMCTFMCLLCSVLCPQPPECPCATIACPGAAQMLLLGWSFLSVYLQLRSCSPFQSHGTTLPICKYSTLRASYYSLLEYLSVNMCSDCLTWIFPCSASEL